MNACAQWRYANWAASSRSGTMDKAVRTGARPRHCRVPFFRIQACSVPTSLARLGIWRIRHARASGILCGIAGLGLASPGCSGMVISGVTMTTSSVSLLLSCLLLNRLPRIGILARPGILARRLGHLIVDQARDHKALPLTQLDVGLHPAGRQRGNGESVERHGVGIVQRGDLGLYVQLQRVVFGYARD